jgi:TonB-linked SusC/RagA family outer membrane protein
MKKKSFTELFPQGGSCKKLLLIMKLSFILTLVSVFNVTASVYSQSVRINLELKNATLESIFQEIQEQTEFDFYYKNEFLPSDKVFNRTYKGEKVEDVLDEVLEGTGLVYKILNKDIVITAGRDLTAGRVVTTTQQRRSISGKVVDASNEPLPGVTVVINGTTQGTITDGDGNYSISNVPEDGALVFSFVGMRTQEIPIAGKSSIDIVMAEDAIGIEEVVAVGYGTMKKADLTGSVSTVKGDALVKGATPNLASTLAGKLTGVISMARTGSPGAEQVDFFIRGKSTFGNGNNSPLVLVDGIERGMNQLNPNDIESVTVLKDAASAAIYGVKGANGVILVTTKRAKKGDAEITYTGNFGVQTPLYLPDRMSSSDYATHLNEAIYNLAERSGGDYVPIYSDEQVASFKNGTGPNTDWWSETMNDNAPIQTHAITIANGSEKVRSRISFEYLDQSGYYDLSSYERYNFRANIDGDITKNLSMSLDVAGRIDKRNQSPSEWFSLVTQSYPTFAPYIEVNGKQELGWNGLGVSPIGHFLNSGYDRRQGSAFQSSLSFNYNVPFIKGMVAKYTYAFDRDIYKIKNFKTPYTYYTGSDPANANQSLPEIELTQSMRETTKRTGQFTLAYQKAFDNHSLSGLFVFEHSDYYSEWIEAYRDGFISDALDQMFAGSVARFNNDGSASESARLGYAFRVNYNYMDKYLVQLNTRYDKSFNFPKDKAGGWFPAVSAAWRISNEKFMEDVSWLSNLKLRVATGVYGNDRIAPFQYLSLFGFSEARGGVGGTITDEGFQQAIVPGVIPNPYVTWEVAKIFNIGADYALFDGKLSGEFEVFKKRTEDLLIARSDIPVEVGASLAPYNIGIVENKGFETALRYRNTFNKFLLSVEGNITYATSKIIEMSEAANVPDGLKQTGRPFDSRYGYVSLGLFEDADDVAKSPDQSYFGAYQSGDIKYKDISGPDGVPDGIINGDDRTYIGRSGMPELVFGFNTYFAYKGFELTANFQGGSRYTHSYHPSPFVNNSNGPTAFTDAWTVDNKDAYFPRLYQGNSTNNSATADYWLTDAWFLKLRNAEFAYNVPQIELIRRIGIKNLRLSVSGSNLLSFTNVDIWDPESPNIGEHPFYYMQMRTVNFGAQVTF